VLHTSGLDEADAALRVVALHFDEQAGAVVWADEGGRIFIGSIAANPRMSGAAPPRPATHTVGVSPTRPSP
jgi:hypothetical protein